MPSARFIICEQEQSKRWAVAMRWALTPAGISVDEAPDWPACDRALSAAPTSLLALELCEDNLEQVVGCLLAARQRFPLARMLIMLASRQLAGAGPLMYEAGAIHVVASTRDLDATARLIQRVLQAAAQVQPDHRQAVLDRIPW